MFILVKDNLLLKSLAEFAFCNFAVLANILPLGSPVKTLGTYTLHRYGPECSFTCNVYL